VDYSHHQIFSFVAVHIVAVCVSVITAHSLSFIADLHVVNTYCRRREPSF